MKRTFFLTPGKGAWTTLFCYLADGVQGGTYYHSTQGILPSSPVSYDKKKAHDLWEMSSALAADFRA